jgi:transcription initiation factor TFIID subunit 6
LLPYFAQFIAQEVTTHVRELARLTPLLRFVEALLTSAHFHVEPYLHQLMPVLLTCLVGKQLCGDPAVEDHWALRDHAAALVGRVCGSHGGSYPTLLPRVTKTLLQALLDVAKPLTTHYGAIRGLAALGPACWNTLVIPQLTGYVAALNAACAEGSSLRRAEGTRVHNALLEECVRFVRVSIAGSVVTPEGTATLKMMRSLFGAEFEKHLADVDLSAFK